MSEWMVRNFTWCFQQLKGLKWPPEVSVSNDRGFAWVWMFGPTKLELLPCTHITCLIESNTLVGTWFGYWTVERVCDCNIARWQEQLETKMGTWVTMHEFQQSNHETWLFKSRTSPTKLLGEFGPLLAQALAGHLKNVGIWWASRRCLFKDQEITETLSVSMLGHTPHRRRSGTRWRQHAKEADRAL